MADRLAHRGPDERGSLEDGPVALGFRRLAIIDVAGGDQPLFNEDASVAVLANGEIYNEPSLRRRLEASGHRFRTGSDCEVIAHLYEDFGLGFLDKLRGMFAIALWDRRRRRLVLARDRMGEKPLYLAQRNDCLFFASELQALVGAEVVPFKLDAQSVHLYFHYQYVPEPRTPVVGVEKVDAGEVVVIDADPWRIQRRHYWSIDDIPPLVAEPEEALRAVLEDLTPGITRADVPIGVALSGGVDSTAIAAMARKYCTKDLSAFSVGYRGRPQSDERRVAKQTADELEMPFHEVELSPERVVKSFRLMNAFRDDPIADISGSGYLAVMQLAKAQGVPVLLAGHGGDELFWGYGWVYRAMRENRRRTDLRNLRSGALARYFRRMEGQDSPPRLRGRFRATVNRIRTGGRELLRDLRTSGDRPLLFELDPNFADAAREMSRLYVPEFYRAVSSLDPATVVPWDEDEELGAALTKQISSTYLRENGIAQCDRLSMAASVELRLPLVDHRFVECVVGLRKASPDDSLAPKARLLGALGDLVPEAVRNRKKRGFEPPVLDWHRALFAEYGHYLIDGDLVQRGVLRREAAQWLSGGEFPPGIATPLSFKALVLEMWCRDLLERPQAGRVSGGDS